MDYISPYAKIPARRSYQPSSRPRTTHSARRWDPSVVSEEPPLSKGSGLSRPLQVSPQIPSLHILKRSLGPARTSGSCVKKLPLQVDLNIQTAKSPCQELSIKQMEPADAGQWRRAVNALSRQIYSSKFILGDVLKEVGTQIPKPPVPRAASPPTPRHQSLTCKLITLSTDEPQVDPMFDSDASGDLHANEIPIELIAAHGGAGEDAVELRGKLDVAEGVIRKLYAKSMETTNENAALR